MLIFMLLIILFSYRIGDICYNLGIYVIIYVNNPEICYKLCYKICYKICYKYCMSVIYVIKCVIKYVIKSQYLLI